MAGARWILTYECDGSAGRVTKAVRASPGVPVEIGREGEVPLGVANPAISRVAVIVVAIAEGWEVRVTNRSGGLLQPWGQAPEPARGENRVTGPLVAIRMLPHVADRQHWVLLEAEDLRVTPGGSTASPGPVLTEAPAPPGALPSAEREALTVVFEPQLRWPPAPPSAEPLLLKQAAKKIGISVSGVQARLMSARVRALALGLGRAVPLTDPAYLYVLVQAGYLDPPPGVARP